MNLINTIYHKERVKMFATSTIEFSDGNVITEQDIINLEINDISSAVPFSQDTELKKRVAAVLNVEVSAGWSIVDADVDSELYLVHYTVQADMNKYNDIRGVVVSLKFNTIICRSYGYTPSAILSEIDVSSYISKNDLELPHRDLFASSFL